MRLAIQRDAAPASISGAHPQRQVAWASAPRRENGCRRPVEPPRRPAAVCRGDSSVEPGSSARMRCRDDAVCPDSNSRLSTPVTRYSGWQIQQNAKTVQGEIDRAVREVTGERDVEIYGSGRTDAGVHAMAQVAHLDVVHDAAARDAAATESTTRCRRISTCCASTRCATRSTPVTTPSGAATSIRSRDAAPRLRSRSSGGSRRISISMRMREAGARVRRPSRLPVVLR